MRIPLDSGFHREWRCNCGHSHDSAHSSLAICQACGGSEFGKWRIVRRSIVGRWYAPWTWRKVVEEAVTRR